MTAGHTQLGWRIVDGAEPMQLEEETRVAHHGGSIVGGSSFLLLVPEHRIAVAVMTNVDLSDPTTLRQNVYRIAGALVRRRSGLAER